MLARAQSVSCYCFSLCFPVYSVTSARASLINFFDRLLVSTGSSFEGYNCCNGAKNSVDLRGDGFNSFDSMSYLFMDNNCQTL